MLEEELFRFSGRVRDFLWIATGAVVGTSYLRRKVVFRIDVGSVEA
jgi:hypothetical protein